MNRIEMFNKEMKNLSELVLRLTPLAQQEMLNYRMVESQLSQQQLINERWVKKNAEAEENFNKVVLATKTIEAQNRKIDEEASSLRNALMVRAQMKYKEVEKMIEDADKSRIKKALKELEAVAA